MKAAREVSKFRRVVAMLASPDPLVYGGMIFGGASPLLSQALPMLDESPFAALPDGTEIPGVAAGAAARRAGALGAASAVLGVPGLGRRRDETAAAPSVATAGTNASVPPVFSLRRAGRAGGGRFEQAGRRNAGDPFWGPATGSKNSSGTRFGEPGTDSGASGGNPWQFGHPGDPGTDRTASEFPAKGAGNPWQSCQSPEGAATDGRPQEGVGLQASGSSGHAAGAALNAALEEVGRLADALLSGAGESAGSFASPGQGSATAGGNGVRPQAGVGRLPPLNTAMEEVGRLAGTLAGGGGESSASLASSAAPTAAASRGGYPAGQTLGQTANFRQSAPEIHVSPGFAAPDAEWLAALVNEALTEQARRHGVDLS